MRNQTAFSVTFTKTDLDAARKLAPSMHRQLAESACVYALVSGEIELAGVTPTGNIRVQITTRLMTRNERPIRTLKSWERKSAGYIETRDPFALNEILECFGMTFVDIIERYGIPTTDKPKILKLLNVIRELRPSLLTREDAAVASGV